MSSALAIAAVTAVLKDLLHNGQIDNDALLAMATPIKVSSLPPDLIKTKENDLNQINLFMYHVTSNPSWRNMGLPAYDSRGERVSNPPLALDLHYLVTAYSNKDLLSEILLGYAMQLLHEVPVLTREAIGKALVAPLNVGGDLRPELKSIRASDLAEQVESIKIIPQYLSTEEISKLWAATQTHYRPTAAYTASVVLIERKKSTKTPLPVKGRNIYALPFRQPVVEKVMPEIILSPGTIFVMGKNLKSDGVKLVLGSAVITPDAAKTANNQIEATLPPGLLAGIQTVRVIHELNIGTPPTPHRGFESNVAPFVLRPRITSASYNSVLSQVSLSVSPAIGKSQQVALLMNEISAATPVDYRFLAAERATDTTTIDIPISGVKTGNYFVRLQVDGAESPLELDPLSPAYTVTQVKIP